MNINKQQMAEWLVENVLHWEKAEKTFSRLRRTMWQIQICSDRTTFGWLADLQGVIYSPDGFFAVWDAVEKKFPNAPIDFSANHDEGSYDYGIKISTIWADGLPNGNGRGKDRYEAFYNAVYEAMKGQGKRDD